MNSERTFYRSRKVVTPEGVRDTHVVVEGETIVGVADTVDVRAGTLVDLGEAALLPGVVDCHAHVNEPGRTEWEGFTTATQAAAAGGITTLVDMPLNSIPATTSRDALATKAAAAKGQCAVDYGFWGGVVPGQRGGDCLHRVAGSGRSVRDPGDLVGVAA